MLPSRFHLDYTTGAERWDHCNNMDERDSRRAGL